jgi:hypothetical protein
MLFSDCGAGPPCDNPTPDGAAFDDALQLWTNRTRSSSVRKRLRAPLGSGASLSRRFQPRTEPTIRPLTPLVALPECPFYGAFREHQNRFHRSRVNEVDFPDPRRLPSTSAPIRRDLIELLRLLNPLFTACAGEPVTVPIALPRWFGFRCFFTPRSCLRISEELDPLLCLRAIHS